MLKAETLRADKALADLTEEQITAIETLSKNDEQEVVGSTVKKIHDAYDEQIEKLTGRPKPPEVKTYKHLDNIVLELKSKAKKAEKAEELENEVSNLREQIKSGKGSEALKGEVERLQQSLKDKQDELNQYKETFESEKQKYEIKLSEINQSVMFTNLEKEFANHLTENKLGFVQNVPEAIIKDSLNLRKQALLNEVKPEMSEEQGRLIFRDKDGMIIRDKDNRNEPITAGKLWEQRIEDLLDKNGKGGAGSEPIGSKGKGSTSIDLTSAKNYEEKINMIKDHIVQTEGIPIHDLRFGERELELKKELELSPEE
jgi:gas vesicle protein